MLSQQRSRILCAFSGTGIQRVHNWYKKKRRANMQPPRSCTARTHAKRSNSEAILREVACMLYVMHFVCHCGMCKMLIFFLCWVIEWKLGRAIGGLRHQSEKREFLMAVEFFWQRKMNRRDKGCRRFRETLFVSWRRIKLRRKKSRFVTPLQLSFMERND
jgi:hypothetical protein